MQPLRDEYLVRSYESDSTGRLSPASTLRYLQETAWNHARALGFAFDPREGGPLVWVLSRLRLEMDRYPAWGERIVVETWPLGVERMTALRDFRILDARGAEYGRASSGWMMLDIAARRPRRPEQVMPGLAALEPKAPVAGLPARIEPALTPCEEAQRRVLYSDIDVNGHVNNVRYFEWVLDSLPWQRLAAHEVRALEAIYLSEALLGQAVAVRSVAGELESRHTIVRLDGDKEVCRVRVEWAARQPAG